MWNNLKMFLWLTFLTGILYPLFITVVAQVTMKQKADGDLIRNKEGVVGAVLIAQKFESDKYFWSRPSAVNYNALSSGGSNLGPTSKALKKTIDERREKLLKTHPLEKNIPDELIFASGSGLDPHLSLSGAYYQVERIAKARGMESKKVKDLVDSMTIKMDFGFLGETCVNVLLLNRALDQLQVK